MVGINQNQPNFDLISMELAYKSGLANGPLIGELLRSVRIDKNQQSN